MGIIVPCFCATLSVFVIALPIPVKLQGASIGGTVGTRLGYGTEAIVGFCI
ncbi:hypothetical protein [Bartonella doshiae]|uniref:hypothetical protein n=1 Tax=Bartonella doshiae TaxID=33044 RepID=UPI0015CF3FE2|nr:hypothetical protein [Bartonella doshiae]